MRLTVLSVGFPFARVSAATAGGAEQVLLTMDRTLVRMGHRSLVLAPAGSRCQGLLIPVNVPLDTLEEPTKQKSRELLCRELRRTLERYPVDVVHMHGLDFLDYLPESTTPVIITLHLPLNWYDPEALQARPNVKLVCVSNTQARAAPPYAQIDAVIPNGVEVENYRLTARRRGRYVLAMGRICPEKAFHKAIDAAAFAGEKLIIAGNVFPYPEHQAYFESMIEPRLGAEASFIGQVGGERKTRLLAGAKCLLIPSSAPETSSLIAMEAMAAGTPVIAMRSGALNEIVHDGRTGFLVNTAEEMAQAISAAERITPEDCRQEAESGFRAETMVGAYTELYQSVTSTIVVGELQAA